MVLLHDCAAALPWAVRLAIAVWSTGAAAADAAWEASLATSVRGDCQSDGDVDVRVPCWLCWLFVARPGSPLCTCVAVVVCPCIVNMCVSHLHVG